MQTRLRNICVFMLAILSVALSACNQIISPVNTENGRTQLTGNNQISNSISTSIPQSETSTDIGAQFPEDKVQIKYSSFAPKITRSEAIAIARNWLNTGFNVDTENLPVDATVALFSGDVLQTNTRSASVASDLPAWIVVIKQVPFLGSMGPPDPNNPNFTVPISTQANVAIDATTGEILFAITSGKEQRLPTQ